MSAKNLYSIDVKVYATAYIRAGNKAEARKIAKGLHMSTIEVEESEGSEIDISGRQFDDPELPDISLSPAMTIYGPDEDAPVECVDGEGEKVTSPVEG